MEAKEFKKYKGKRTFGAVGNINIDGCIVIGYESIRDEILIVGCYDSRGWIDLLRKDVVDENLAIQFESFLYVNVKNVKIEKDLDLTSILKGCEGVELFSEVFGVVELYKVIEDSISPICIKAKEGYLVHFTIDGKINHFPNGNCVLWPSETNRDWATFVAPVKVRDDDFVVACDIIGCGLIDTYKNIDDSDWKYVIRFEDWKPDLTEKDLNKLNVK